MARRVPLFPLIAFRLFDCGFQIVIKLGRRYYRVRNPFRRNVPQEDWDAGLRNKWRFPVSLWTQKG